MIMKKYFIYAMAALCLAAVMSSCCRKTVLFNGKNLDGWVLVVNPDMEVPATDVFSVRDGKVLVSGTPYGYMRTEKKYGDYKLHAEWRWIGAATNSGLFQRVQDGDGIWPSVMEVQLCGGKAGDLLGMGGMTLVGVEEKLPGLFYKERISGENPEKPDGEWNTADIEVAGTHVKVWINGKFQNEADCDFTEGYIALQSEGGPLEFRNVCVVSAK